ncbi:cytochrome P450 2U1-like isoform X2 [Ptychodera flava]|uniref:cytochrome P450 2U1-like isoform X2 n=1 Tax=Ptychodera flava TaxID=63121 RepID=UPI003969E269
MDIQAYIVSIVAFLAILWLFNRSHNTPPGPLALPLVGNMLSLSKDAYLDFDKMADRYGSVFQLKLGPTTAVILHGYDAVYQAFVRQGADFSDRPSVGVFERLVRDPQYPDTGGKRERRKPGEGTEVFTEKFLWRGVLDIFQAGSETTSGALCWAFLYMAVHTDVQEKVQKEIEDVIGSTRPATYSDKTSMPYTAATIKEILRLANVTPYAVPRCTSADTTLYQYVIPKGTMIMASVWSVHHDKKYWQDVETFLPERFLDETGNIVHKDAYIPFSLGPRNCLGKQLVNVMMFLIFVNALQKYSLSLPENEPSPDLKGMSSTTRVPMPYRLCALKR